MVLDRKDYKTAIPQLEKRLKSVEQDGANGLAKFDVLQEAIEKEILTRKQALLKTSERIEFAIASADGKSTVYHSSSAPTGGTYKVGDTWFDASHGYAIHTWNGTSWVKEELGTDAIEDLSIVNAKIANGTIQSAKIGGLDVGKLTGGYIDAGHINTGAITVGSLQDGANYSTTSQMNSAISTAKSDAEKVATNYLSTISGTTGISVHDINDERNFANMNSNGMTIYQNSNDVATFGSTSRIGKLASRHTSIKDGGFYAYSGSETDANLFAQLGYGLGNSETGTATAPYYSFGIRKSNSSGNIGNYSVAEGYQNNAKGYASHAEGLYTEAVEKYTHSQNIGTVANSLAQTVIGTYNEIDDDIDDTHHPGYEHAQFGKYAFIVGNGSDEHGLSQVSRSNALTIDWYGRVNAKGYYLNTVDIFNPTLSSVGLSPISSRCTIQSGGIVRLGSWVFVQLCLKVATSLSASSWGLVSGLPTPSTSSVTALSASIQKNTGGNISANVTAAGNIAVQLPSSASADEVILINGWYISA